MRLLALVTVLLAALFSPRGPAAAEEPVVRIAVLKFGTVNWITETIVANRLDEAQGYRLEVVELAGKAATTIAFRSGEVDLIVTDWMWAFQQRDRGLDLKFAPYSNALGAVMTSGEVDGVCDLKGRPVGVVGGERDKSWIVLQALVTKECGFDLASETQTLVGAAPLMSQQLLDGTVDAVSTYWPHAARLEAQGKSRLIGVDEAMARLGIDPAPALIGFVWNAGASDAGLIDAFLRSVTAAQNILADDDAEWERLRPRMAAADDAEFRFLRDHFRAGIVTRWTEADTASAERLQNLLIETAGGAFAAEAGPFDTDLFDVSPTDGN